MPEIIVEGGKKLNGSVSVQGSKNAVLPVIAATVLCSGVSVIENCPCISDVYASINILKYLGAKCSFTENVLTVDSTYINKYEIPDNLMREMRSSSIFLGAILGRKGAAQISTPGGCELGPRPIDLHIKALKELGADVSECNGSIRFKSDGGLYGREIHLSFSSVGATENIILASSTANGTTIINNAAKEPEILDLADFLNSAGADIKGAGTDRIIIVGKERLYGTKHIVIPDRIVAATYISAVAITGGEITLNNVKTEHIRSIVSSFEESGCLFDTKDSSLKVSVPERLKSISTVRTQTYPGFPTDAGPMLIAAMSLAKGTTVFVENIFENRYRFIDEIKRFGANIKTEGKVAIVEGRDSLFGAECECTDLRGGAALTVAALAGKGKSIIKKTEYIERGYEDIVRDLKLLGAHIIYM